MSRSHSIQFGKTAKASSSSPRNRNAKAQEIKNEIRESKTSKLLFFCMIPVAYHPGVFSF
tara:strand:+ start:385 stop:564 length:180 start_codon:yes stop_codon:yes gene_type:complete